MLKQRYKEWQDEQQPLRNSAAVRCGIKTVTVVEVVTGAECKAPEPWKPSWFSIKHRASQLESRFTYYAREDQP